MSRRRSGATRTHPAVQGFDRAAGAYERGRPEYPATAVRYLARQLGLRPGAVVVELGSGTGKLTRQLIGTGATVLPVEPTPGMRAEFARKMPGTPVLDGVAEAIPLPDGVADAVVAAQAFHWFRTRPTLREVARVLRPRGQIALIWNLRDESRSWVAGLTRIIDRYAANTPRSGRSRWRRWRRPFEEGSVPFTRLVRRTFRHVQVLPPETVVDRFLSVSFVAMRSARERREVARQVRELLAHDRATRGRTEVALPYRTVVYVARRTGRTRGRRRAIGRSRSASRGTSSRRSTTKPARISRAPRAAKSLR